MNPVSRRAKPTHLNGNEVLIAEYLGKTFRVSITQGQEDGIDDTPVPEGCDIRMNLITHKSVAAKEVRKMLGEAKSGDSLLFICRSQNVKKHVLAALGLTESMLTA